RNGQTIVIGGLKQQETSNVRTRVPVLGSIPVLGPLLFQTKNITTTQTELVLFITPRILSDTGHLPDAEEKTLKQNFLDSNLNRPLPPAGPITLQVPGAIGVFLDSNPTLPPVTAPPATTSPTQAQPAGGTTR
ncbi:MAG: hypothetical protein JOZ57_00925, partial [Abitibacteriaceae bacterium]|nr:hypothetical protein [Abditibacteriaceae bacterium]